VSGNRSQTGSILSSAHAGVLHAQGEISLEERSFTFLERFVFFGGYVLL